MYIVMNCFCIIKGCEQDFINVWKNCDFYLEMVLGFKKFNLL